MDEKEPTEFGQDEIEQRQNFVKAYMTRSNLIPYTQEGEVVTHQTEGGHVIVQHALKCNCGEEMCKGWAMVAHGCHHFHKHQNGLTNMSFEAALKADMECLRKAYSPHDKSDSSS